MCGKCSSFTSTVTSITKTDESSSKLEIIKITQEPTTETDFEETETTTTLDSSTFSESIITDTLDMKTSYILESSTSTKFESIERLKSTTELIKTTTGCSITDCQNNGYFNSALCECQCNYKNKIWNY